MTDRAFTYELTVRVRHSRMGFGRTVEVVGASALEAMEAAATALAGRGYTSSDEFDVVELKRGRIAGRRDERRDDG